MKTMKKSVLVLASCMAIAGAHAQLKVLQTGNTTIGGGNSPFPYSNTRLSVNGSVSMKSSLELINLNNTNTGWGAQIRFTPNNLTGINHTIVDNGVNELIIYPGFNNGNATRHVQVYGGLNVSGYSALAGGGYFSDQRLKANIAPLNGSLDKIMQLRGVTYSWKKDVTITSGDQNISLTEGLPEGQQIGFIAQEVEKIIPEIVKETSLGYKALEYHTLTALLVNAMQEQQAQIKLLENKIEQLNQRDWSSSATNDIRLGINYPNPFDKTTVIAYSLPATYAQSELYITDLQGKLIFSLPLETGTDNKVEVSSDRLENGIYLYSIVSNGTVLITKQFVVSK
jgi:hypothetical protein